MYLGIDIGTSGVKAVLVGEDGAVSGHASSALSVEHPHPLWSEQDPRDWWRATCRAVDALDPVLRKQVQAVGLAGQMHGATLLGKDDQPLRPAILWNDGRSYRECVELEEAEPRSREITGNIAMPGFTAPKLAWLRKHEPQVFADTQTVLLPKDYVRLCMTGEKASDMSDSAGTLWLDVARRDWSDAMLAATGLSRAHMPGLLEGCEVTGTILPEVADQWGMDAVPVAAGAGDNAAGAVGVGVLAERDAFLSLGTSGVIFVSTNEFRPNTGSAVHTFCHCLPDVWHQMSVHLSAASCLDWAAVQLGQDSPADVLALAQKAGAGNGPELFLPFLSGERTPHNAPHLRAGFLQLDNDTNPGRLAAAVLEGVAFALADGLQVLRDAGTQVRRLSVIGGGARSTHWGEIIASVLDVELDYVEGGEIGPALGAARLARLSITHEDPASVCVRPAVGLKIAPDPLLAESLSPKLRQYRKAVQAALSI